MFRRLSSLGYRKKEPVEIRGEDPELLDEILQVNFETRGTDFEGLANLPQIYPEQLAWVVGLKQSELEQKGWKPRMTRSASSANQDLGKASARAPRHHLNPDHETGC